MSTPDFDERHSPHLVKRIREPEAELELTATSAKQWMTTLDAVHQELVIERDELREFVATEGFSDDSPEWKEFKTLKSRIRELEEECDRLATEHAKHNFQPSGE